MFKSLMNFLILFFLTLFTLEVGSFLIIRHNRLAPQGVIQQYKAIASEHVFVDERSIAHPISDIKKAHYSYGFTFVRGNNHGFIDPEDFPYFKKDNELIIGIFGGSTAMHWAQWLQKSDYLSKAFNKKIRVLNMAISGMKQPQQYAVASRFIETLDVALFYDGWNEMISRQCPNDPELPSQFEYLINPTLPESLEMIRFKSKLLRIVSDNLQNFWLRESHFIFLIWNQFKKKTLNDIQQLKMKYAPQSKPVDAIFPECQADSVQAAFNIWAKYTQLSKEIANYYDVKMLHFYQANPYLEKAKPLSAKEKKIVAWNEMTGPSSQSPSAISGRFHRLYKNQPWSFSHDLAMLFMSTQEVTYIDPYTHLNSWGYEILSKRVVEILKNRKTLTKKEE